MQRTRRLTVKEYISELKELGSISSEVRIDWENKNDPPSNRYTLLRDVRIVRDLGRGFIISHKHLFSGSYNNYYVRYAYFPSNLDHAVIFSRSSVLPGGPQDSFPGSVAVLKIYHRNGDPKIDYLQNCYKMSEDLPELNRALASKYGGASRHLLETFFEESTNRRYFFTTKIVNSRLEKLLDEISPKYHFVKNSPEDDRWWKLE